MAVIQDTHVTVLSERRAHALWGVNGGVNAGSAAPGEKPYPGKFSLQLKAGDSLRIKTPGGGGYTNNLRVSK